MNSQKQLTIIEIRVFQFMPPATHNEQKMSNLNLNNSKNEEFATQLIEDNADISSLKVDDFPNDKKIAIPERHRKAASLQYHPTIDHNTQLLSPKNETGARPRVSNTLTLT